MLKKFIFLYLALLFAGSASAEIVSKTVDYGNAEAKLQGVLTFSGKFPGKRPAILLIPSWMGIGTFIRERASRLADLGYVVFVADMYGKGVHPENKDIARAYAGDSANNRTLMRARIGAALQELRALKNVNADRIAAMGYGFGGMVALELARSGAPVTGAVVLYGALDTPNQEDAKNIKGKILVLQGAEDPFVPENESIRVFEKEMHSAKVNWELVKYSKAKHGFAEPEVDALKIPGAAYDAETDRRSWRATQNFFSEILPAR